MHTLNLKKFYPFTYLEFERQNATCFLEKTEKFFKKAVYLKNIPSLVPTGRGHLGIVIPKKGKKICPPEMASKEFLSFSFLNIGEKTFNSI